MRTDTAKRRLWLGVGAAAVAAVVATGAFGVSGAGDHDFRRHRPDRHFRGWRPGDLGADLATGVAVDGQGNLYIVDR